jgi:hypothetical protein
MNVFNLVDINFKNNEDANFIEQINKVSQRFIGLEHKISFLYEIVKTEN